MQNLEGSPNNLHLESAAVACRTRLGVKRQLCAKQTGYHQDTLSKEYRFKDPASETKLYGIVACLGRSDACASDSNITGCLAICT